MDEGGRLNAEVRWSQRGQLGLRFDRAFELRSLSRAKAGAGGLKMLTPAYLEPRAEPAPAPEPTPLLRKRSRGA